MLQPSEEERALSLRIRNLGLLDWSIWSREDSVGGTARAAGRGRLAGLVVDLGSIQVERERAAVAEAVLAELWELRDRRRPTLCVIDEAHNVCPATTASR